VRSRVTLCRRATREGIGEAYLEGREGEEETKKSLGDDREKKKIVTQREERAARTRKKKRARELKEREVVFVKGSLASELLEASVFLSLRETTGTI